MNPELIPQNRSLEVKRTSQQLAQELIDKGYVKEAIFSAQEFNPTEEEIENMPEEVQAYIPFLIQYRNMPILTDDLDHRHHNDERSIIKAALEGYDADLAKAYKNDNKLQSSNIMHTLAVINLMRKGHPFSDGINDRIEILAKTIDGQEHREDPDKITANYYKVHLDNAEKRKVAEDLDQLVVDIFDELIAAEKKE